MNEGYHIGSQQVYELAKLPKGWHHTWDLHYPMELTLLDGSIVDFRNYEEHHAFIKSLFTNKIIK